MPTIVDYTDSLRSYSESFQRTYLAPADAADSVSPQGNFLSRIASAISRALAQALFNHVKRFRNYTINSFCERSKSALEGLLAAEFEHYNPLEEVKTTLLKHRAIYVVDKCKTNTPLYTANLQKLNRLIAIVEWVLAARREALLARQNAPPAPLTQPSASLEQNDENEQENVVSRAINTGCDVTMSICDAITDMAGCVAGAAKSYFNWMRTLPDSQPKYQAVAVAPAPEEVLAPSAATQSEAVSSPPPPVQENTIVGDANVRAKIRHEFITALKNEDLADFMLQKFFPEGSLAEIRSLEDGSFIIHFDKEKPSGLSVPKGTIVNGKPLTQDITGQVGKIGTVPEGSSKKMKDAYIVLDDAVRFKLTGDQVIFLDKEGKAMTINDHGLAHTMSFTVYISTNAIRSDTTGAWIVFPAEAYISLAPISLSYDNAKQEVEMLYITNLTLREKLQSHNGVVRRRINQTSPELKQLKAFKGGFDTLSFAP